MQDLFPGLLLSQLDVKGLPVVVARDVFQRLADLEISAVAEHGFPCLWDSDAFNE